MEESKDRLQLYEEDSKSKVHFNIPDYPNSTIELENTKNPEVSTKKPQQLIYNSMKRKTYSKYDLVKVKVFLEDHFYIFSRFLISRILTLIKVKIVYNSGLGERERLN